LSLVNEVWSLRKAIAKLERSRDGGDRMTLHLLRERFNSTYADYCAARAKSSRLAEELGYKAKP
jgi:hypothetical protein